MKYVLTLGIILLSLLSYRISEPAASKPDVPQFAARQHELVNPPSFCPENKDFFFEEKEEDEHDFLKRNPVNNQFTFTGLSFLTGPNHDCCEKISRSIVPIVSSKSVCVAFSVFRL